MLLAFVVAVVAMIFVVAVVAMVFVVVVVVDVCWEGVGDLEEGWQGWRWERKILLY